VKGKPHHDWKVFDLKTHEVVLMVNGETKLRGSGSEVLGHPLNSLTWMANTLVEHGSGLKAGDLISTGVCTDLYHANPGDEIVADFGKIGKVELSFDKS
jgi:2-keto-4-pentenoate hydratase